MKRVLVVEDYADTRALMRYLLQNFGYEVLEATDGQDAINKIKENSVDLILMDISMPVMDGLTATQIIRQFEGFTKTPIIAVTAYGKSYYRQAIEAGCDDLINKPLDFNNLKPLLEQYLL
ncbi:MAG: response regulator [Pyrinomonadaceae bacterium]|nr:response regulator [Pyrinomonadaceae bacterium]